MAELLIPASCRLTPPDFRVRSLLKRCVFQKTLAMLVIYVLASPLGESRVVGKEKHNKDALPWSSNKQCISKSNAEETRLKTLCNPYNEGGSPIHILHGQRLEKATQIMSQNGGNIESGKFVRALMLDDSTRIPLSGNQGEMASWTINNPNLDPVYGHISVVVERVPCATHGCCATMIHLRENSTDLLSLYNFFTLSEYRFLLDVPIEPRYILDVGGVGMSAVWLGLMYPNATIFRLEPNADNFMAGVKNSLSLSNVKQFSLGLWNKNTVLQMCHNVDIDWGSNWPFKDSHGNPNSQQQAFYTLDKDEGECTSKAEDNVNVVMLSSFMDLLSIPAFDLIKMDIEGAEGKLFAGDPGIRDVVKKCKLFVAEFHERFFPGTAAPVRKTFAANGFVHFADDENEIYIHPSLLTESCKASHSSRRSTTLPEAE